MRYWFDTEFDERDQVIHLISIAIVAEDGRSIYLINADYDASQANPWLQEHVIPHLSDDKKKPKAEIRESVLNFFSPAPSEIWAYYGEYDWIVLRQLVGHMIEWPAGWPMSHMNIAQWHHMLGKPDLPQQDADTLHDALADARWCQQAWRCLEQHPL